MQAGFAWIPDRVKSVVWYNIYTPLFCISHYFYMFATIIITLLFISFMFLVIMFIDYFDYMLSIVGLSSCSWISLYSTHSKDPWVSGQHCVSVVLIRCLPADTPYIPGHVVDQECDTSVESFVVHSPNIGMHVGCSYEGRQALFLIFLSNIPYV
jgi:hypothetical protein